MRLWLGAAGLSLLIVLGCEARAPESSESASAAPAHSDTGPVALELVNCARWDEALARQRGRIVVVDTWATWCVPCREEFPGLVALHRKYAPQGVVCMSVSVDDPDQKDDALAFLRQQQAAFANYLIQDASDAWFDKWNIKGIPIVLVFGADGTLARKFDKDDPDNQYTYEDVDALVAELLEAQPATP